MNNEQIIALGGLLQFWPLWLAIVVVILVTGLIEEWRAHHD